MSDLLETLRDALAGSYAVERELGRGGMATVFLAEDLKHRRPVAIKVLHPELAAAVGAERFLREIEIAARLQHPHILPLYDSGAAGSLLYYVMPYVEGESLRDRLNREKQLGLEDAVRITTEVAGALAYAHSHGVVHRDIKPENILLSGGTAVVADFGIARALSVAGESQPLTQTGTVVGTPAYMSPEQATGSEQVDGRSDQYSLACVLYEMLVGEPPFTGATPQAVMARHSLDAVSRPSIVRATIPDAVEHAVLRALNKIPADRFPTTALFAEEIQRPSTVTDPRARITRATSVAPRWLGLPRKVAVAAGAAVVIVGALAARSLWPGARTSRDALVAGGLDPRHVAVLYFQDLSQGKKLGYLADGLTEALIDRLAGLPTLNVTSKNGAAQYRDVNVPRDSVARALKVGNLIEGSVEGIGDRLRVTVRLVDGVSGADVERRSFEWPKGDVLRVRDSVAAQVAGFLRRHLGDEIRLREERAGTKNVAAWVLVQQAEKASRDAQALAGRDSLAALGDFRRADSLLALAEQLDPSWAQPIVSRAAVAYRESRVFFHPPRVGPLIEQLIDRGLEHAERVLRLDPKNADALELRGTLRYWRYLLHLTRDPAEADKLLADAERDLRDAVRNNPAQATAWSTLSHLDYQKPDFVNAKIDAQRAYEADAYLSVADQIVWRLFTTSYDLEQFADAAHWCDEGQRRFPTDPRFVQCRLFLMTADPTEPNAAEAWRLVDELHKLTPEKDWPRDRLEAQMLVAAVLARAGLADSARHLLARSTAEDPKVDPERELLDRAAFAYTLLKDRDHAIRLLQEQIAANPQHRVGLAKMSHWWWRDLRNDRRFQDLVGTSRP